MHAESSQSQKASSSNHNAFDLAQIQQDFPGLSQRIYHKPLIYLDNAATCQRSQAVITACTQADTFLAANIHRGVHWLSGQATIAYEKVRTKVQTFLNAQSPEEIIFTRGTTESINLVAQTYGRTHIGPGDEVVITHLEHHSNIVPWQVLCQQQQAKLVVVPMDASGNITLDAFSACLTERTKLVACTHVSNALGTVLPLAEMIELAHARNAVVVVDGAQSAAHLTADVQALGCDFFAFSAHKIYGPTGVGVLWGKKELLEQMPPYQVGGGMINAVTFEQTTYSKSPYRFEAGTPNITGVLGLGAALDYWQGIDHHQALQHEATLLAYATERLSSIRGINLIGTAPNKVSILSFVLDKVHPHDIGTLLDQRGIAIRTGHHCAQPTMQFFKVPATARASFGIYNSMQQVDALVDGIQDCLRFFS